jgi:GNAT superfamily N-acetyltransferase
VVELGPAIREASGVRKATAAELPQLAGVLARAFYDDPPTSWVLPDDARRMRILERSFLLFLRKLWFPQGECYTTEGFVGAAAWELPGAWKVGVGQQLRLLPAMASIYGRLLPRLLRAFYKLESNHPHEPHFYLPFVGVDPDWQGRGIGAALIGPVLERCDREGIAAYLEASTPRSRSLYERLGFAVTEEFQLGEGSPPVWRMWRTPAR